MYGKRFIYLVSGRAGYLRHNGPVGAEQGVEQARLTDIRPGREGDLSLQKKTASLNLPLYVDRAATFKALA